jgi:exonuclease VII large subunit
MQESHTDWLRGHMRDHVANSSMVDSADNILNFQRPPYSAKNPGAAALDLVYQAAELIGDVDNYAAERQARAENLAKQAIEKLKIADDRVRSAESARRAAEAEIKEFSDRVEKELSVRLQEIEEAMEQTASRIAATEAQLSAAEQRARTAEIRANEAENALKRIEEAIRTRILAKMPADFIKRTAAAA